MTSLEQIRKVLEAYDSSKLTIGTLGGHSALDICRGAKDEGFRTLVVCQKGREKTYTKHYKGIVDETIILDRFADITMEKVQQKLREMNTLFVHSRYFWVYCDYGQIENNFNVPIFGTRNIVRAEERDQPNNQYFLLAEAGIRTPKRFNRPEDIDRLAIVKASEAARGYERAFFFVSSFKEYAAKAKELVEKGTITKEALQKAVIEEFAVGPQVNLNFFYSALTGEVELLGTDARRQTNIDGILRLTSEQQLAIKNFTPKYIESGHMAVTLKESLLEKAFELGERFVDATKKHYAPGIIGPFALQGAVVAEEGKEEFVIFDCSLRIPGSPGIRYTPYGHYLYGQDISVGRRIAMEIKAAAESGALGKITT